MVQAADTSRENLGSINGRASPENGDKGGVSISASAISLNERYLIFPGTPLSGLDGPSAKAYLAQDKRDLDRALFALVCPSGLPPRTDLANTLKEKQIPGLLSLIDWGIVDWTSGADQCMALIYERPLGGRVLEAGAKAKRTEKARDLQLDVVTPLYNVLNKLNQMDIAHRAIRPDNLFFLDVGKTSIVLGDCLATPPGYDQPIQFETIDRGICPPAGRGLGGASEDLYALGVTLIYLLLGGNPVNGMSPNEIIDGKINAGTFSLLAGRDRFSPSIRGLIQGLLVDDSADRWSIQDVGTWIDGGQPRKVVSKRPVHLERGFRFAGDEYRNLRALAMALFRNYEQAADMLREDRLERWVRLHLKSPVMADKIAAEAANCQAYQGDRKYAEDVMVARVCIILDPDAPVRYKGLAYMPDGFGAMLVSETMGGRAPHTLLETIHRGIQGFWFETHEVSPLLVRRCEMMKSWLKSSEIGFGVERCLYEANKTLPCQSKFLEGRFAATPKELLFALDKIANTAQAEGRPMDRHIAAFIASRMNGTIEKHLRALSSAIHAQMILGMLGTLATVQWRTGIESLFGLASWVGGLLAPALEIYHSKLTRRAIEKEIPRLVRRGSLPEMFKLIQNAEALQGDESEFQIARREYDAVEEEILKLDNEISRRQKGGEVAQQVVALGSILLSFFVVAIVWIVRNWNGA